MKLETTTDCITAAQVLYNKAKKVTNEEEHRQWWDEKVELLKTINKALASGFFTGEAYNELWTAKNILYTAEAEAGKYAMNQ